MTPVHPKVIFLLAMSGGGGYVPNFGVDRVRRRRLLDRCSSIDPVVGHRIAGCPWRCLLVRGGVAGAS